MGQYPAVNGKFLTALRGFQRDSGDDLLFS
jgi:hypothetical protein